MKRLIAGLCFVICCTGMIFSQNKDIEIVYKNENFTTPEKQKEFYYIPTSLDSTKGIKVADIRCSAQRAGNKNNLSTVFYKLWEEANKMGANAFFLRYINYLSEDKIYELGVNLCFLTDDEIDECLNLLPRDIVVIIGNTNTDKDTDEKNFKLNGEKINIRPYEYIEIKNEPGSKTEISIGGFFGSKASFKGNKDRLPVFVSLSGASLSPQVGMQGQVGLSISTGNVFPVDMNFGLFIMDVIDSSESKTEIGN